MRRRTLAGVARRYAAALEEFAALSEADVSVDELQRRLRVLREFANTWHVMVGASAFRVPLESPQPTNQGVPVSDRVYVFVRDGVMYECTCNPKGSPNPEAGKRLGRPVRSWTIRVNGCEADGPEASGKEFTNAERTVEFEDLAVAAVKACRKPCAMRQG